MPYGLNLHVEARLLQRQKRGLVGYDVLHDLLLVWVCIHDIFVYDLDLGSTYFLFSVCNVSTHTLRTRCL